MIGDGARWIRHLVDEIFPKSVQIVGLYLAREKVRDVAKSVYGPRTDLTEQLLYSTILLKYR